jgi:hypothetical protein
VPNPRCHRQRGLRRWKANMNRTQLLNLSRLARNYAILHPDMYYWLPVARRLQRLAADWALGFTS